MELFLFFPDRGILWYTLFNQERQGNAGEQPEEPGWQQSTGTKVEGLSLGGKAPFLKPGALEAFAVKPKRNCIVPNNVKTAQDLDNKLSPPSDSGGDAQHPPDMVPNPGGVSTLVHPKETSRTFALPRSYRSFVAKNDNDEMEITHQIYDILGQADYGKKLNAFETCRTSSWFVVNVDTREIRVAARTCKLRWCPMCAKARMRHLTSEVTSWFEHVKNPKFLTLTVQHNEEPLHDQVKFLYECFKQFRKRSLIKKNVKGGVWFFQIHRSKHDGLWHPHLHCVLDSGFIPRKKLSELWRKCTLTSCVIDIRAVKRPEVIAEYVARYAARPSVLSKLSLEDRMELVWCMHGKRLCGTWGNAREISLRPSKPDDADKWRSVGGWSLIRDFLHESDQARAVVNAWRKSKPLPDDIPLASVIEINVNLPWEAKSLEHEPIQLSFFGAWANPPPVRSALHESS